MTEDNTKTVEVDFKFSYIELVTSMANGDTFYDGDSDPDNHYVLMGKSYRKVAGEDLYWVSLKLKKYN